MREHTDARCWCRPLARSVCPLCRLHGHRAACPACGGRGSVAPYGAGTVFVRHWDRAEVGT